MCTARLPKLYLNSNNNNNNNNNDNINNILGDPGADSEGESLNGRHEEK